MLSKSNKSEEDTIDYLTLDDNLVLNSNKLDINNLGKIGIDRLKVYIDIISMDLDLIPNRESLGRVEDKNGLLIFDNSTKEHRYINKYSYVSRSNKESVRYGLKIVEVNNPRDKKSIYKMLLDITAPRLYYGLHNIYNINEESQVDSVFNTVYYELYNNGIHIDLGKSEIQSIELNKTFEWNQSFLQQEDVLDYMFKILNENKFNKSKSKFSKEIYMDTVASGVYSISSNRSKIKIYDKSAQVFNTMGIDIDTNLYRVELTLNRSGISNAFSSNELSILRNMNKIENVFLSYMRKSIINPIRKHIIKEIDFIESLVLKDNYRTLDRVYKSISKELIDVLLLGIAAFNVYKSNNNNNFDRDFRKLLTTVSKNHINRYLVLINLLSTIKGESIELIGIPENIEKSLSYYKIEKIKKQFN